MKTRLYYLSNTKKEPSEIKIQDTRYNEPFKRHDKIGL